MTTGFSNDSSSTFPWIAKDPSANLDFTVDWSAWLGADTISTVLWTVATGLTKTTQSNTNTLATAWLSGGIAGKCYTVACRITTAAGRVEERSFQVRVQSR